jgi:hypothetical protein
MGRINYWRVGFVEKEWGIQSKKAKAPDQMDGIISRFRLLLMGLSFNGSVWVGSGVGGKFGPQLSGAS